MDKKNKRIGQNIKIKKYDDIFEDKEAKDSDSAAYVTSVGGKKNTFAGGEAIYVSPHILKDFNGHPFKVAGSGLDELMGSINEHGILSPLIVRPAKETGFYEIISGHRRKHCAVLLELPLIPVIIRNIDDDEAILAMVDSNIQREDILPSEKAFAYKMKMEAIKRQGARRDLISLKDEKINEDDLTCGQVVHKLKSADIIGMENNESGRQIRRYVRLTELPEVLLDAVDNKKMSFNTGVELSYLTEKEKQLLVNVVNKVHKFPSLYQAKKLREISAGKEEMTADYVAQILVNKKDKSVNFERQDIRDFFPKEYTAKQIEERIIEILKELRERG